MLSSDPYRGGKGGIVKSRIFWEPEKKPRRRPFHCEGKKTTEKVMRGEKGGRRILNWESYNLKWGNIPRIHGKKERGRKKRWNALEGYVEGNAWGWQKIPRSTNLVIKTENG